MPGIYTRGVRRTPNQPDSDVTSSGSCDQGKITKKSLKDNCGRLITFQGQISKQLSYFNLLDLAGF